MLTKINHEQAEMVRITSSQDYYRSDENTPQNPYTTIPQSVLVLNIGLGLRVCFEVFVSWFLDFQEKKAVCFLEKLVWKYET